MINDAQDVASDVVAMWITLGVAFCIDIGEQSIFTGVAIWKFII